MKPLTLLLIVFAIGFLVKSLFKLNNISTKQLAKVAMSSMLIFTGIGHFAFADGMSAMLPEVFSHKTSIIYLTGILEILGAIGLLISKYSKWVGVLLILFFLTVLPANIYAALHHIDPLSGYSDGPGPKYLFFRIPLQLFFIFWIYKSAVE